MKTFLIILALFSSILALFFSADSPASRRIQEKIDKLKKERNI